MTVALQKLAFTVDLFDKVSGPAGKMQKSIQGVTDTFSKVAAGAAGIAAAGYAVRALTAPAQEFNMAIGEVRSLDVAQDALDKLSDKAIAFSTKYGVSATDFVSSSYDIQSAIGGLKGSDLADFTYASGVLAKSTKADTATITSYMGTMYGIFQTSADKMGKAEWVQQLSGQTALAVNMFSTDGANMSAAFENLGAAASIAGIEQAEQLAVLGQLQLTMGSGATAGTAYNALMGSLGSAQEKLGLTFTDQNDKMLGIIPVLEEIRSKYGDTLEVAEQTELKSALGDNGFKAISALYDQTTQLGGAISDIGKVKGMDKAEQMAKSMIDPFQRWDQGIHNVRIGLGQALLPVILPVVDAMADGAGKIYNWTQAWPNLTRWIGYGVVVVSGFTGVLAAFAVMGSVAKMATLGYGNATKFSTMMTKLFSKESMLGRIAMFGWTIATKAGAFVMGLFTKQSILGKAAMLGWNVMTKIAAGGMAILKMGLMATRTGFLWLNAAMLANPVVLIIAGVVALVAAVAAIIYYWDDLKAAFMDTTWGKNIMGWIDKIIGGFQSLTGAWDWMKEKFSWVPGLGEDSTDGVLSSQKNITPAPGLVDGPMAEMAKPQAVVSPVPVFVNDPLPEVPKTSPSLEVPRRVSVPAGGVSQSIATAITNNSESSSQTIHIGQIVTSRPINAQEVTSQLVMAS